MLNWESLHKEECAEPKLKSFGGKVMGRYKQLVTIDLASKLVPTKYKNILFRLSTSPPELTSGAGLDTRCPLTGGVVLRMRHCNTISNLLNYHDEVPLHNPSLTESCYEAL